MARNSRDVELIIRAENKASAAIEKAADSLSLLEQAQTEAGQAAARSGTLVEQLGKSIGQLEAKAKGLQALGQISTQLDKAGTAVGRLEAQVAAGQSKNNALATSLAAAAARATDLKEQAAAAKTALDAMGKAGRGDTVKAEQIKEASEAFKTLQAQAREAAKHEGELRSELAASTDELGRQSAALDAARSTYSQIQGTADRASAALGGVATNQAAVAEASKKTAEQLAKSNAALAGAQAAAGRTNTADNVGPAVAKFRQHQEAVKAAREEMDRAQVEVDRLAAAMAAAENPTAELNAEFLAAKGALEGANAEYGKLTSGAQIDTGPFGELNAALTDVSNALTGVEEGAEVAGDPLAELADKAVSLAVAMYGIVQAASGLKSVLDTYMSLEAAQVKLNIAFEGNEALAAREFQWVRDLANRLKIDSIELSDQYGRLASATAGSVLAGQKTRDLFQALAGAARANKLSVEQTETMFANIIQMISKGKVQADELKEMSNALSSARRVFAEAFAGGDMSKLVSMMEDGAISAGDLDKIIKPLVATYDKTLPKALQSTSAAMGDWSNAVTDAKEIVGKSGFVEAFTKALKDLTTILRSHEAQNGLRLIGSAAGSAVTGLASLLQHMDVLSGLLAAGLTLKLISFVKNFADWPVVFARASTAITAFNTALAGATGVWAKATVVVRALWAAMTGPVGLAIMAASVVGGAAFWATTADKATEALDRHKKALDELKQAYAEAKGEADKWRKSLDKLSAVEIELDIKKVQSQLDRLMSNGWSGGIKKAKGIFYIDDSIADQIDELGDKFANRKIDVDNYVASLEKIAAATDSDSTKEFILNLIKNAEQVRTFSDAVKNMTEVLKLKTEGAKDATAAQKLLGDQVKQTAADFGPARTPIEKYNEAIKALKELIPELAEELEDLEKLNKINALEQQLRESAAAKGLPTGQLTSEGQALLDRAKDELNAVKGVIRNTLSETSDEIKKFYGEIKGSANLMSKNPQRFGTNSNTAEWQKANLVGVETASGQKAQVNKLAAAAFQGFIDELESLGYKIDSLGGYAYRNKRGGNTLSEHAFANAIDINPAKNPMGGRLVTDMPANIGLIAAKYGLSWGGDWKGSKDAMHFEWTGRQAPGMTTDDEKIASEMRDALKEANKEAAERVKNQENLNAEIDKTISKNDFDAKIADARNNKDFDRARQLTIEQEVQDRINDAKAKGLTIDDARIAKLREVVTAEYDAKHGQDAANAAKKEAKDLEQQINDLVRQRSMLMEQETYYRESGNAGELEKADALKERIKGIDDQIRQLIPNAMQMAKALGDNGMISNLENVAHTLERVNQKTIVTGKQINEMLADGLVGAFDQFAEAVANGENAFTAARDAFRKFAADFLRQIASMIAKQLMLNLVSGIFGGGTGGGGGIGGIIAGGINKLFHTGGVVGAPGAGIIRTGGGSAALWNNAPKFHKGGVVGLKPGERRIIAKDGEIIDPGDGSVFSKFFGGGNNGSSAPSPNVTVTPNVNVFFDPQELFGAFDSSAGEEAVVAVVRRNPGMFRQIINEG